MYLFQYKKKTHGFTLIEMIVVISLFTIVSLIITDGIVTFYKMNGYAMAQSYQVSHARQGLNQLVQDFREMTFADDGTFPLAVMSNNKVGFYSDIDRDASVEYIEYELSSTTLYKRIYNATGTPPVYRTTPDATTTVSEYVQNKIQNYPIFVYYDESGHAATGTTTITDIRYIAVNLIVNIDPVRDPGEFSLRSSAALRNLKNVQ